MNNEQALMVVQPEAGQLLELEFVGGLCLTILNTIHYEQNLRKNLWATGSLS